MGILLPASAGKELIGRKAEKMSGKLHGNRRMEGGKFAGME